MANLFKKAKETGKKATVKKNDKIIVLLEEVLPKKEAIKIADQIKRKSELETTIAALTGELKTIDGDLKNFGKKQFYDLYKF